MTAVSKPSTTAAYVSGLRMCVTCVYLSWAMAMVAYFTACAGVVMYLKFCWWP